jgi:predicted 3-demethylubiquinone-9 3-methyltransferase (glyoxalase superfamily)
MAEKIFPCLWFDNNAIEAAQFYCSFFPKSKIVSENPMVVTFELNGAKFMALNGGQYYSLNASISLFYKTNSVIEADQLWEKLSENGTVLMAYSNYPWAEKYGWLKDKYGLTWQIMISNESSLMPSLLFSNDQLGNAKPALELYTKIFENTEIIKLSYYNENSPFSGKLNYSETKLNNYTIIAMDGPGSADHSFNEAFSFVINCDNQQEIDYYWSALIAEGGHEGNCGWCKDKFGISWQVVPSILSKLMADPTKSKAVVAAFLKMKKFEIDKLLAI